MCRPDLWRTPLVHNADETFHRVISMKQGSNRC